MHGHARSRAAFATAPAQLSRPPLLRQTSFRPRLSVAPAPPPPAHRRSSVAPTPCRPRMCVPVVQREFDSFEWRDWKVNYRVEGNPSAPPVLLIHGFGANVMHWCKNIHVIADAGYRVYAIDLVGFGASPKPNLGRGNYNVELWRDQCIAFCEWANPAAKWSFVGNSNGSLVSQAVAAELGPDRVKALCLVNSSSAMVSFRYSDLNPIFAAIAWAFNTILFNRFTGPGFFERFRTRENVKTVLEQAYAGGKDAVSEELVSILCQPAFDEGATAVFLAILNGPPGPHPRDLLPEISWCPILALWGADDPFTPFRKGFFPGVKFADYHPTLVLEDLGDVGHCPHDARPDVVNQRIISFLLNPAGYQVLAPVSEETIQEMVA